MGSVPEERHRSPLKLVARKYCRTQLSDDCTLVVSARKSHYFISEA